MRVTDVEAVILRGASPKEAELAMFTHGRLAGEEGFEPSIP